MRILLLLLVLLAGCTGFGLSLTMFRQRLRGGFGRLAVAPTNQTIYVANSDNQAFGIIDLGDVHHRDRYAGRQSDRRARFLPGFAPGSEDDVGLPERIARTKAYKGCTKALLDGMPPIRCSRPLGRPPEASRGPVYTAFHDLIQRRERLSLVLVGDGILRNDVERYIHQHSLEGHVVLTGPQPQPIVANWLRAADVFVLPSAYEGMPMSVLEALGCGTPVVSTDVGEVRRVVHPGENGEIAESRTPAGVAAAIGLCVDRLARYTATQCTRAVTEYVPERVLAPVYANYRRIAAHKLKHAERSEVFCNR